MLLWTWVYKYLFEILHSVLLGIYPEVELLDHMTILFLIFWGTTILFSTVAVPVYITTNSTWRVLISPHPYQHLFSVFLIVVILITVEWLLILVLICISLMVSSLRILMLCLLAIRMSSLERSLFKFFAHFWIGFMGFLKCLFIYLFIYFWLCWVLVAAHGIFFFCCSMWALHCGAQASL